MCKVHSSRKRASENFANLNDRISDCKWSERTKRENRLEKSADSQGGKGGWTWAKRIAILVTQLIRYVKYRSKNRNKTETPYAASRGARAQGCPLIVAHRLVNPDYQVNIRWKVLDEIYKIYMLLHRSDLNISEKNRQTFSHFSVKFCKIEFRCFFYYLRRFLLRFWWTFIGISQIF